MVPCLKETSLSDKKLPTKVFVIEVDVKQNKNLRTPLARLQEAVSLTKAINLNVVGSQIVSLREVKSATLLGSGNIENLLEQFKLLDVELVLIDCSLTPIQQRNLEKAWQLKVIDRTALILEIFGERAHTKEGRLQVELAHLTYQRSRLVRSWTHLERQRGGAGFLGGPGETQIEIDRRIIDDKLVRIKKELEHVKQTRALQRKSRKKVPFPIVSLVGYTNAGKSTLFNYLTKADVFAQDLLFATLDPTMRQLELPSGKKVILSDTVGFISELPTELVAAFRATLEEVLEADLILHVRDCSHEDSDAQKADVEGVLKDLGLDDLVAKGVAEVLNKTDLLDEEEKKALSRLTSYKELVWPISAKNGDGIEELLNFIDKALSVNQRKYTIRLPYSDGKTLASLYEKGAVLSVKDEDDYIELEVSLSEKDFSRIKIE
ncbi:MAG: GTPase HflX [Alphaproteobacteria bacterium]|nr:GTPase HflX [Alphaproteobacteria bacterium]